jgi:hypothetical protein
MYDALGRHKHDELLSMPSETAPKAGTIARATCKYTSRVSMLLFGSGAVASAQPSTQLPHLDAWCLNRHMQLTLQQQPQGATARREGLQTNRFRRHHISMCESRGQAQGTSAWGWQQGADISAYVRCTSTCVLTLSCRQLLLQFWHQHKQLTWAAHSSKPDVLHVGSATTPVHCSLFSPHELIIIERSAAAAQTIQKYYLCHLLTWPAYRLCCLLTLCRMRSS